MGSGGSYSRWWYGSGRSGNIYFIVVIVGDGGNTIDSLRYFNQNSSDILGLKIGYKSKVGLLSLGYDRILPNGQFLSPREWGREDLFSFQKRERSEGSADNHALVFNYVNTSNYIYIYMYLLEIIAYVR